MKNVQLDETEEERAIRLNDGFDLPVLEIGRMKNKQIKRMTLKKVCSLREEGDSSDDTCASVFVHKNDDIPNTNMYMLN